MPVSCIRYDRSLKGFDPLLGEPATLQRGVRGGFKRTEGRSVMIPSPGGVRGGFLRPKTGNGRPEYEDPLPGGVRGG